MITRTSLVCMHEHARRTCAGACTTASAHHLHVRCAVCMMCQAGTPEVVQSAVAFCAKHGTKSAADIVHNQLTDAFLAALQLETEPRKQLESLLHRQAGKEEL